MTLSLKGYAGKILRVNLTREKIFHEKLNNDFIKKFLGGKGFASKILYDIIKPRINPLAPENVLVFAIGPLNGTFWPQSGRYIVASKSPLTGIWGESHSGGHWGNELKYAGFDAIVIEGASKNPVYLYIQDEEVEIKDAKHLWGRTVEETEKIIEEEVGYKRVPMICIGQAGENLVRYSAIITRPNGVAARAGMGAVMGSKKLKAIAVKGFKSPEIANPDEFYEFATQAQERLKASPFTINLRKYGTAGLVDIMNEIGRFPTKNHQTGVFPMAYKINAETISSKYKSRNKACFNCPIGCKQYGMIGLGQFAGFDNASPEYETLNSLGGRCWNDDLETILYMNWLCNQYGLDTISTGAVISFIMELWEKGIITKEDTNGLDFSWGNKETMIEVIKKIAFREGIGNILAEGVKKASEIIGKGSEKYAMHVKGLEIPSQDGRAHKSMAIAHATSPRGADHLRHCTFYDEIGFPDAIVSRFGEQYLPEMADRLAIKYKGILAKGCEDAAAIMNALPLCVSGGTFWPPLIWWNEMSEIYSITTGISLSASDLKLIADKIVNLKRAYNIKHCLSKKDDNLPERFLKEPLPEGPPKGHVVELEPMLSEYYKERGWDLKTGLIPRKKLEALGLKSVADELEKIGKLPE